MPPPSQCPDPDCGLTSLELMQNSQGWAFHLMHHGYSTDDIANILQVKPSTVRGFLTKARHKIQIPPGATYRHNGRPTIWLPEIEPGVTVPFTPRQYQIHSLYMAGYTLTEITQRLQISRDTAQVHLVYMRKAIEEANRQTIIAEAQSCGMTD